MNKSVALADMYDVMEEMLASGGTVEFNTRGTSMLPTLHNDGDRAVLKRVEKLQKNDIAFYRRDDGAFVLHRVIKVEDNGTYTMCGDNQWVLEKGIRPEQIIAKAIAIIRKGKKTDTDDRLYNIYVSIWVAVRPVRRIIIGGKRKLFSIIKRMIKYEK